MSEYTLIATCAFGLEALVRQELDDLGLPVSEVRDGRVLFEGDAEAIAQANLWLRTADRVLIELARFPAETFDQLFDATRTLPWAEWLPRDAFMHVTARSHKSKLFSLRDCQKIVKKAMIEALRARYNQERFSEDGPRFPVEVALLNDQATLTLDTTGPSLHKRGYRSDAGSAPLKETLAAALVKLSRWEPPRLLADPLCGSGTILIEAALIARNQAPGLQRDFQGQAWPWLPAAIWQRAREQARKQIQPIDIRLLGSDSDGRVLKKARDNAEAAGVADLIAFQTLPVSQFRSRKRYGVWISNPPYGERLSDRQSLQTLYAELRAVWAELPDWSYFMLSGDPQLEQDLGKRASKRRKLFNGQIPCQYYQYFGPWPERAPRE
ncbi:MAG: class I SAM-dependent RNA methyltransferase [Candidatus Sericytochromatia bacterium]|nr:class I SAM-dependent RNA methyltransferase [Candidatus Sericytochromatia bacterium]